MVTATLTDYVIHNIFAIMFCVISVWMVIKACKTMNSKKYTDVSNSFKISYLSVLIVCSLWFLCVIFHQFVFTLLNTMLINYNGYLFCQIYQPLSLTLLVGYETSILNYFVIRIQQLLKNPKLHRYRLPNWLIPCYQIINVLSAIIIIILGSMAFSPIIVNAVTEAADSYNHHPSNWTYCASINDKDDQFKVVEILGVYCGFVFMMNLIVWFIFINRFYIIIQDQPTMIQNDEGDLSIIHIMKKQTLLVGIAITSTIILWTVTFNVPYALTAFITDHFITEICVFLSFGAVEQYYARLGCGILERKCCDWIENVIQAKLSPKPVLSVNPKAVNSLSLQQIPNGNETGTQMI